MESSFQFIVSTEIWIILRSFHSKEIFCPNSVHERSSLASFNLQNLINCNFSDRYWPLIHQSIPRSFLSFDKSVSFLKKFRGMRVIWIGLEIIFLFNFFQFFIWIVFKLFYSLQILSYIQKNRVILLYFFPAFAHYIFEQYQLVLLLLYFLHLQLIILFQFLNFLRILLNFSFSPRFLRKLHSFRLYFTLISSVCWANVHQNIQMNHSLRSESNIIIYSFLFEILKQLQRSRKEKLQSLIRMNSLLINPLGKL